jgi:uncharacterized protein DUF3795
MSGSLLSVKGQGCFSPLIYQHFNPYVGFRLGCQASHGDMFYGECAVAKCAISKKLEHCGLCPDLPCKTLQAAFDNPEHGDKGERYTKIF